MSNRQQRRHPTHPALSFPQPSGEKVTIPNGKGKTNSKRYKSKREQIKVQSK